MNPSFITKDEREITAEPSVDTQGRPPLQLLKTGFHTMGSNVLCAAISILTTWVIARLAGPTIKGSYDLYIAAAAMMNMIVGFSLPSGLVYVSARRASNPVRLVPILFLVAGVEGVITCGLFLALHNTRLGAIFLPKEAGALLILGLSLTVGLAALTTFLRAVLVGSHRFIKANLGDVSKQAIGLVAAAIALTVGFRGHYGVMALICANILSLGLAGAFYLRGVPFREHRDSSSSGFRQAASYSAPCYLANLAQFMNYKLDVFFVNAMVGAAALGIYQLAVTLTQSMALLPAAASTILLPLVAAEHEKPVENAQRTAQVARLIVFISVVSASLLGGVSYWIIPRAFGAAFSASVGPLLVLLPGAVFLSLAAVLASHLAGMGFPDLNLRASLAGLLVTVPLDIVLIPRMGILGASLASTSAYFVSTALNIWYFHRKTKISVRELTLIAPDEIWSMLGACKRMIATRRPVQRVTAC